MAGDGEGAEGRFAHVPALDGLRALAVLAVLGFHAQLGLPGGFLGVSLFFTLSGYLITSLLLVERANTGRVDLHAFWSRRLRRLMPASLLCIALVVAASGWWVATQRQDLPGDVIAALAYVANWHFILDETTYQELFIGAPSPLAHFWSLAIEEQIYVVLPVVAACCLRWGRRLFAGVVAGLLVASVVATLLTSDRDLVYQGTHTRAAEVLVGVLLAIVLSRVAVPRRVTNAAGTAALAALAVLVAFASTADEWIYRGGLLLVALLSATTIAAAAAGTGPARLLAWRPLALVGTISYGLYLFHWPVFLVLDESRTGLGRAPLFTLRIVVTTALALASYHLVEQPVRRRRILVQPARSTLVAVTAVGAVAILAVTAIPGPQFTETERLLVQADAGIVRFEPPPEPPPLAGDPASADERALSPQGKPTPAVLVVGSSATAVRWLHGLGGVDVIDGVRPECAIASAEELLFTDGAVLDQRACPDSSELWTELVGKHRPAVVVAAFGQLDRGVVRSADDVGFPAPGDLPAVAARWDAVEDDVDAAMGVLLSVGVPVVVVDADDDAGGVVSDVLARLDLHHTEIDGIETTGSGVREAVRAALSASPSATLPDGPLRVLVTGDSVSLDLARALSDGGEGRLDVTWAGESGCPFARVEAFRLAVDLDWMPNECTTFDERLPPLLHDVRPDVVLLSVSVIELAEQRYPGESAGHVAGDPEFASFHEDELDELVAMLAPSGTPLLVADALGLRAGGFATTEMADPARLAAWNDFLANWVARHPGEVAVFPFAGPLRLSQKQFGVVEVVPDGVHPTIEVLTGLARWVYVPLVVDQTAQLSRTRPG